MPQSILILWFLKYFINNPHGLGAMAKDEETFAKRKSNSKHTSLLPGGIYYKRSLVRFM
jgi:hypothetical protein